MKVTEVQHDPTYTLELTRPEVDIVISALSRSPNPEATRMAGEIQVGVWGPPQPPFIDRGQEIPLDRKLATVQGGTIDKRNKDVGL